MSFETWMCHITIVTHFFYSSILLFSKRLVSSKTLHFILQVKLASEFVPNHNLQMCIKMDQPLNCLSMFESGNPNAVGLLTLNCLAMHFMPSFLEVASVKEIRNEIVFVIDRSGMMVLYCLHYFYS